MKADPRYLQASSNLASMLEGAGRWSEALDELRRLLTIEPDNVDARIRLGTIYAQLENWGEAAQHLQAVLEQNRRTTRALLALASVHRRSGDTEQAMASYERLEGAGPGARSSGSTSPTLLRDRGDLVRSEAEVERYLASHPRTNGPECSWPTCCSSAAMPGRPRRPCTRCSPTPRRPGGSAQPRGHLPAPRRAAEGHRDHRGAHQPAGEERRAEGHRGARRGPRGVRAGCGGAREGLPGGARAHHPAPPRDGHRHLARRPRLLRRGVHAARELEQIEEDEVPIIEIGGKEPLFAVPEESEDLKLGEAQEQMPTCPSTTSGRPTS